MCEEKNSECVNDESVDKEMVLKNSVVECSYPQRPCRSFIGASAIYTFSKDRNLANR